MSQPSTDRTDGVAPESEPRVAAAPASPAPPAASPPDLPRTMRAACLVERRGVDGLRLLEIPTPIPGHDEVLVEVHTVGANQLDLNTMHGRGPGADAALPLVLGADPAGVVVAHGGSVPPHVLGRRVVVKPNISCGTCRQCRQGDEANCPHQTVVGVHRDGGAAPYVAVPLRNAFDIGDLDFAVATASVHSVPIALHVLNALGGVSPGSWVLVTGPTGAVGAAAVDLAVRAGARVIAASTSRVVDVDGVHGVRYDDAGDLVRRVHQVAPAGVDLAVDGTGHGAVIGAALECLGWQGRLGVVAASLEAELRVDARDLYLRRKSIVGAAAADYLEVRDALDLVTAGTVRPAIGARVPLDRIAEAYAALGDRGRVGKVVVDVR